MKKLLKLLYVKFKNKGKAVEIRNDCNISVSSTFEGNNFISNAVSFSGKIGYASYIGANSYIVGKIGRFCCISSNVKVVQGKHPSKVFVSVHPAFYSPHHQTKLTYVDKQLFDETNYAENNYAVVIGNDVWIGANATIMEGVKIGDGAIIGAGSIVTKNVAPYSIVGGVPAKIIRKRFEDNEIDFLNKFKWWDRDLSWIKENASLFSDVKKLMKAYGGATNE